MTVITPDRHTPAERQIPWTGRTGGADAFTLAHDSSKALRAAICGKVPKLSTTELNRVREFRRQFQRSKRIGITISSIVTATAILSSTTQQYLNHYELFMLIHKDDPAFKHLSDEEFRTCMAFRVFDKVSLGDARRFAERTLKFGCDTKYAACTFQRGGVPHYGPVTFIVDADKLPHDSRRLLTCFIGDSAKVASVNIDNRSVPHNDPNVLLSRYALARHLCTMTCLSNLDDILESQDAEVAAFLGRFSSHDNVLEVHIHGSLPISCITELHISKSAAKQLVDARMILANKATDPPVRDGCLAFLESWECLKAVLRDRHPHIKLEGERSHGVGI